MNDPKVLTEILRECFLHHECWYGCDQASFHSEDVLVDETEADLTMNYNRAMDKESYLTIIFHAVGPNTEEKIDLYFFNWYDNRDFAVMTKNGKEMTYADLYELLRIMKAAGFNVYGANIDLDVDNLMRVRKTAAAYPVIRYNMLVQKQ